MLNHGMVKPWDGMGYAAVKQTSDAGLFGSSFHHGEYIIIPNRPASTILQHHN